jgi:hypothetical protein
MEVRPVKISHVTRWPTGRYVGEGPNICASHKAEVRDLQHSVPMSGHQYLAVYFTLVSCSRQINFIMTRVQLSGIRRRNRSSMQTTAEFPSIASLLSSKIV